MHLVDLLILAAYAAVMLGVGVWFMRRNRGGDDYYVGGRDLGSVHVGLSVVATDVGGGFSIGLGGLGFTMGLSGSWMLFTGLVGAWLSAVLLIPRVKRDPTLARATTFPDLFRHHYGARTALVAGVISAIGYAGFTAAQLLAGAKLAAGTFPELDVSTALWAMGVIAVAYTVLGGLKAVIFTDTIQWAVLMGGLVFIGIPVAWTSVGGWPAIQEVVEPQMLTLSNVGWATLVNWAVTIVPIWFVGMTLYQRIYACRDEATAKRAWFIAGLFEWPVMAFMGVVLGLLARVAADQGMLAALGAPSAAGMDPETGLPMLLAAVLPVGLLGLMMAAYFSAILSTADSCLLAASGNVVSDVIGHFVRLDPADRRFMRLSQVATLVLGVLALLLASRMTAVLDLMLYSYAFMVSGLLVPVLGAMFLRRTGSLAPILAMVAGGGTTVGLELALIDLPLGLDANVFGITASAVVFGVVLALVRPPR